MTGNEDGPPMSAEEQAFYAAEMARGELAFAPDELPCYACGGFVFDPAKAPMRRVTGLGGVTRDADPTQVYRLECGHGAI